MKLPFITIKDVHEMFAASEVEADQMAAAFITGVAYGLVVAIALLSIAVVIRVFIF